MRPFRPLTAAAAATAAVIAFASMPALASPVTHTVSAVIDTSAVFTPTVINGLGQSIHLQIFNDVTYSGMPITINDGDTIEINFTTINGGITLNDAGFGFGEALVVQPFSVDSAFDFPTDNPGGLPVLSYDRTTTVTVTDYVGDLVNNPLVAPTAPTFSTSPTLTMPGLGNFTDSSVTINEFTISSTFSNFVFESGFESFAGPITITDGNSLIAVDEVMPAPAPGALALLGFGVIGLFAARRKTV